MRFRKALAISIVSLAWTMPVLGQTLDTVTGPAELPPLGFKGTQFVDSTGCVFIRAGFDGRERWVPRVLRSKKVVCGFKPSFELSQTRPNTRASGTVAASGPVLITLDGPAPAQVAPVLQPQATSQIAVTPITSVQRPKQNSAVPTGPEIVRAAVGVVTVPKGYEPAWQDGRLNPKRGIPTVAGIAASDLKWTRTVPRKLIQSSTGRDVTSQFSKLIYPFTNLAQQERFLAAQDSYVLLVKPDGSILMTPKS